MRDEADHRCSDEDQEEKSMRVASVLNSTFIDAVPCHSVAYNNEALVSKIATRKCVANFHDGSKKETNFDFKDNYKDIYTNEDLDPALTREAIANEMEYFNDKVWVFLSAEEAKRRYPKGKILGGTWVMHNKGDTQHPGYAVGMLPRR